MPELRDRLQATLGSTYTLERELGGGGMSRVFLAEERALGRRVVVKVLPDDLAATVSAERFRREIQLAATLQHPHIVPVLTAGEADGVPFYAMPLVDGESLRERLRKHGAVPVGEAVRILRDVASALAFAHGRGVVHRDIKPENVLLSGDSAVVTDFGIAKAIAAATTNDGAAASSTTLTALGAVIGTPAYMSPEQVTADPNIDARSDLYALGCLAFELLVGHAPFAGRPVPQVLAAQVAEVAPALRQQRPDVPRTLDALVTRLLAKRPEDRPRSAQDVIAALDSVRGSDDLVARWSRARPARVVAATLAIGAGVAFAWHVGGTRLVSRGDDGERSAIAVLPLSIVGGDTANRWFAEGTTEELSTELQKLAGVRVISPASASIAVGRVGRDPQAVGKLLGVGRLLDGSVRRAGSELRLTLRLVNAGDGTIVWSNEYPRTITSAADIFQVQSDIARAVAGALRVRLLPNPRGPAGDVSLAAHDLYLRGRYHATRFTESDLNRSIQLYDSALTLEPRYALAWAAKSEAWTYLADTWLAPREAYPTAKHAALEALAIDSSLAEAHGMLADVVAIFDWNPAVAEAEATRALALNPHSVHVLSTVIFQLMAAGQLDSTIVLLDRAQRLDPLNTLFGFWKAWSLFASHRVEEGCREAERGLAIAPDDMAENWLMGDCMIFRGRAADGLPYLRRAAAFSSQTKALYARGLALAGHPSEARALIDSLEVESRRRYVSGTALAGAYGAMGDLDGAFRSLERGLHDRSAELALLPLQYFLAPLRSDPRFQDIVRRMRPL